MERRTFLKTAAAASAAAASSIGGFGQVAPATPRFAPLTRPKSPNMQYRQLGRTGEEVSAIGMGGYHIGKQQDPEESIRLIRTAVDRGITFLDNCWDYNDGLSEVRMGHALRDGYRSKVFLMTKMDGRTKDAYNKQLEQSLGRLQTDMIDLVQFHEVIRLEDPDRIFAPGGAMEAALAARQAGKIRYIGFTGHKDPLVHLRMIQMAQAHGVHLDTAQMPVNVMDAHFRSFSREVVPVCNQQGIGVLAMKTFGDGFILKSPVVESRSVTPIEMLHFSLNQPVSVVITGMDSPQIIDQAFEAVRSFKPLSQEQVASLLERTANDAANGQFEPFKTSSHFDGTAANPKYLG